MEIQKPAGDDSLYRKEIQKGVEIFRESFNGLQKTKNFPQKKMEYEKAMGESLKAIQDAASALANKELTQQKEQLSKDYQGYLGNPNEDNAKKVEKDLDSLQDSSK